MLRASTYCRESDLGAERTQSDLMRAKAEGKTQGRPDEDNGRAACGNHR
jgi:hypothetical protein